MFRWIRRGLRIGKLTTRYPWKAPESGALGSPLPALHPQGPERAGSLRAAAHCPTEAIRTDDQGVTLDYGRCIACGLCWRLAPESFVPGPSYGLASRTREGLMRRADWEKPPQPYTENARQKTGMFRRSLHLRHLDAGSDAAIEFELTQLNAPQYDLHRLGIFFSSSPRHADALLVTGPITRGMVTALQQTFEAMPAPKLVIAAGTDAISGGLWADGDATGHGVDAFLPVDIYIPGSPPSPLALMHGLLLAAGRSFPAMNPAPISREAREVEVA